MIKKYNISSQSYLNRAKDRFNDDTKEGLIYSVLELRSAIEARLREILEPQSHVSNRAKKEYRIHTLTKEISDKVCNENIGSIITIVYEEKEYVLKYIPLSSELRKFAEKSGTYLHALHKIPDEKFWDNLRKTVEKNIIKLEEGLKGNLLGPILVDNDGFGRMNAEMIEDDEIHHFFQRILNGEIQNVSIKVEYFDVD